MLSRDLLLLSGGEGERVVSLHGSGDTGGMTGAAFADALRACASPA